MITPDQLKNRMVPQSAIQQPRPFDFNEPSTRAPVPTAEEQAEAEETSLPGEPGEHAEIPHPRNTVVEGDEGDDAA